MQFQRACKNDNDAIAEFTCWYNLIGIRYCTLLGKGRRNQFGLNAGEQMILIRGILSLRKGDFDK